MWGEALNWSGLGVALILGAMLNYWITRAWISILGLDRRNFLSKTVMIAWLIGGFGLPFTVFRPTGSLFDWFVFGGIAGTSGALVAGILNQFQVRRPGCKRNIERLETDHGSYS